MSMRNRVRKIHKDLQPQSGHKMANSRTRHLRAVEIPKVRGDSVVAVEDHIQQDVCLMVNVQPITKLPKWAQWMVRFIYFRYGWAAMAQRDGMYYSVEYRGVTPDEAEARHMSSADGCSYTKIPWRSCLSIETGQYSTHDFPLSEESHKYRKRELPFIQVRRRDFELLEAKIEEVARSASA